jgi:hypothetical protein
MSKTGPIPYTINSEMDGEYEIMDRYVDDQGRNVTVRRYRPKILTQIVQNETLNT